MSRDIDVVERDTIPWPSVVLGYGPMLPFLVGAVAVWCLSDVWRGEAVLLTILWAATILAFLAGVRRGLSFRTQGGPALMQIATMAALFMLALGSLIAIVHGAALVAAALALVGFVAVAVLDPIAARNGQAPLFFAQLRPPQMAIPILSLAGLLANAWLHL